MTCAKRHVIATLTTVDGTIYIGTNACQKPQDICPRAPGEDYTKCGTVCQQPHHAEVAAIVACANAGDIWRKGHISVEGIGHICTSCMAMLTTYEMSWELKCPA